MPETDPGFTPDNAESWQGSGLGRSEPQPDPLNSPHTSDGRDVILRAGEDYVHEARREKMTGKMTNAWEESQSHKEKGMGERLRSGLGRFVDKRLQRAELAFRDTHLKGEWEKTLEGKSGRWPVVALNQFRQAFGREPKPDQERLALMAKYKEASDNSLASLYL